MKKQKIPVDWIKIHFKDYPRFDKIKLPKNFSKSRISLEFAIKKRKSRREFRGKPLSLKELSKLLYYSSGITRNNKDLNQTRRAYPSAGARYPLELYVLVLKEGEIKPGLYHYNAKNHFLEKLLEGNYGENLSYFYEHNVIKKGFPILIIITSITLRSSIKYGKLAQNFVLLEAGHIGQNIYLLSEAMGLSCCAIGGWDEINMNKLLDIDGNYESIVYIFALGKKL